MLNKIIFCLFAAILVCNAQSNFNANNTASIIDINTNRYSLLQNDNTLSIYIKNNGKNTIENLEINWTDGSQNHFATIATHITSGATKTIQHTTPINYKTVEEKAIYAIITKVNATPVNISSEVLQFNTVARQAKKAVLVEEGTGGWCAACPAGDVAIKYMYKTYPETFIGVAVHRGDPMENELYKKSHTYKGLPGFNVDRVIKNEFVLGKIKAIEPHYLKQIEVPAPADLSGKASISGNELSIKTTAKFYTDYANADIRLGVILTEDGISGPSPDYDQANSFSGKSKPMGGYEKLPNPVPGPDMSYDHVGRALLGGFKGQRGSIPTKISNGDTPTYTFEYEIPSTYKIDNLNAIIVLVNQADGAILNAKELKLKSILSVEKHHLNKNSVKIYPNPAAHSINIAFEAKNNSEYAVTINDITGKTVLTKTYSKLNGTQNITIPTDRLPSGSYIVSISNNNVSYNKHIILK